MRNKLIFLHFKLHCRDLLTTWAKTEKFAENQSLEVRLNVLKFGGEVECLIKLSTKQRSPPLQNVIFVWRHNTKSIIHSLYRVPPKNVCKQYPFRIRCAPKTPKNACRDTPLPFEVQLRLCRLYTCIIERVIMRQSCPIPKKHAGKYNLTSRTDLSFKTLTDIFWGTLYLFVYILMITNRGFGYNWLVWAVEGGRLQGRLAPSGAHNQQTEPST